MKTMLNYKGFLYITTVCWLLISFSIFFFVADDKIILLGMEDGFYETAGAIFFSYRLYYFLCYLQELESYIFIKKCFLFY